MFKYQDLQMFVLKLNKNESFSLTCKLWVAVARHNLQVRENLKYLISRFKG